MAKKMLNVENVSGYVYEHNLAIKTVQNTASENYGKEFIAGSLDVATSEDLTNIVTVKYTYVTPTTKKGTPNTTYNALKTIIESGKTVLVDGKENATKVKCSTSLSVNDFYTQDRQTGEERLVSAKQNDGGFVTIINSLDDDEDKRSKFEVDMLINGTRLVEADEERHIPEDYLVVKGAVFNFRNELMPVELHVHNQGGIKYFESLDASPSNMTLTKVWGVISSQVTKTKVEEESAWGEPIIREYERTNREWVVTGTAREPYDFGDEAVLTTEEVTKMLSDREIKLATEKKRQEEWRASQSAAAPASPVGVTAASGAFNF